MIGVYGLLRTPERTRRELPEGHLQEAQVAALGTQWPRCVAPVLCCPKVEGAGMGARGPFPEVLAPPYQHPLNEGKVDEECETQ